MLWLGRGGCIVIFDFDVEGLLGGVVDGFDFEILRLVVFVSWRFKEIKVIVVFDVVCEGGVYFGYGFVFGDVV